MEQFIKDPKYTRLKEMRKNRQAIRYTCGG